jgi:hypothetical protein
MNREYDRVPYETFAEHNRVRLSSVKSYEILVVNWEVLGLENIACRTGRHPYWKAQDSQSPAEASQWWGWLLKSCDEVVMIRFVS